MSMHPLPIGLIKQGMESNPTSHPELGTCGQSPEENEISARKHVQMRERLKFRSRRVEWNVLHSELKPGRLRNLTDDAAN